GRRQLPRRLRAGRLGSAGRRDRRAGRAPHRPGARARGSDAARPARALHHRAADHERQADDPEGARRALRLLARARPAARDPRQGQAGGGAGRADGRAGPGRGADAPFRDGVVVFTGMTSAEEVHAFWFGPQPASEPALLRAKLQRWYSAGPALDEQIRKKFGPDVERALAGELDEWA